MCTRHSHSALSKQCLMLTVQQTKNDSEVWVTRCDCDFLVLACVFSKAVIAKLLTSFFFCSNYIRYVRQFLFRLTKSKNFNKSIGHRLKKLNYFHRKTIHLFSEINSFAICGRFYANFFVFVRLNNGPIRQQYFDVVVQVIFKQMKRKKHVNSKHLNHFV